MITLASSNENSVLAIFHQFLLNAVTWEDAHGGPFPTTGVHHYLPYEDHVDVVMAALGASQFAVSEDLLANPMSPPSWMQDVHLMSHRNSHPGRLLPKSGGCATAVLSLGPRIPNWFVTVVMNWDPWMELRLSCQKKG
jgi:hypothetical protein